MILAGASYLLTFIILICYMTSLHPIGLALLLILAGLAYSLAAPGALSINMRANIDKVKGSATAVFYMTSVFGGLIGVAFSSGIMTYFDVGSSLSETALFVIMLVAALISLLSLIISMRLDKA